MSSELTTRQAAEATGVPFAILTRWLDEVPVPHRRDDLGQRKFGPEGLAAIERVKSLRLDDGRAVESIRAILGPLPPMAEVASCDMAVVWAPDEAPKAGAAQTPVAPPQAMPTAADIAAHVGIVVAEVVRRETELAEKYARAAYEIGELRARLDASDTERQRLVAQLADSAAAGKRADTLEAERDRLNNELAEVRLRLALVPTRTPRPWWRVWG